MSELVEITPEFMAALRKLVSDGKASAAADVTVRFRAVLAGKQAELDALTAKLGASDAQVLQVTAELERAKKIIADLMGPSVPPVIVQPPKVDPPKANEPWPLQYLGKTPDQLKDVRPPGWHERRAALPSRETFEGPVDLRKTGGKIEHTRLTGPNAHYIQKLVSHGRGVKWTEPLSPGSARDILLDNVEWDPQAIDDLAQLKWFLRAYNLENATFRDVVAKALLTPDGMSAISEHLFYFNPRGDGLIDGCLAQDFGGKPFYWGYRDQPYEQYQADNLPGSGDQLFRISNSVALDCDRNVEKGSFAATGFDVLGRVELEDNVFVSKWQGVREKSRNALTGNLAGDGLQSCGMGMFTCYQHRDPERYSTATATFKNQLVSHYGNNHHALLAVRNTEHVIFDGCLMDSWDARGNFIEIGGDERFNKGQRIPAKVSIRNCDSSTGLPLRFWAQHNGKSVSRTVDFKSGAEWTHIETADVFA